MGIINSALNLQARKILFFSTLLSPLKAKYLPLPLSVKSVKIYFPLLYANTPQRGRPKLFRQRGASNNQ